MFEDVVEVVDEVKKLSGLVRSGNEVGLREAAGLDLEDGSEDVPDDVAGRAFSPPPNEPAFFVVKFVAVATLVAAEVGELAAANDSCLLVELLEAAVAADSAAAGRQNVDERLGCDQHVPRFHRRLRVVDAELVENVEVSNLCRTVFEVRVDLSSSLSTIFGDES